MIYASGHPFPMCLAAMYLPGIAHVYYAHSNEDGEPFGFLTGSLYGELAKPLSEQAMRTEYPAVRPLDNGLYQVWRELHPTSPS